ncbi:hypothetical protein CB1_000220018 [Camelus ferus]|nr:hypothetical protein CB1_000220018 [Camelus ferus]
MADEQARGPRACGRPHGSQQAQAASVLSEPRCSQRSGPQAEPQSQRLVMEGRAAIDQPRGGCDGGRSLLCLDARWRVSAVAIQVVGGVSARKLLPDTGDQTAAPGFSRGRKCRPALGLLPATPWGALHGRTDTGDPDF